MGSRCLSSCHKRGRQGRSGGRAARRGEVGAPWPSAGEAGPPLALWRSAAAAVGYTGALWPDVWSVTTMSAASPKCRLIGLAVRRSCYKPRRASQQPSQQPSRAPRSSPCALVRTRAHARACVLVFGPPHRLECVPPKAALEVAGGAAEEEGDAAIRNGPQRPPPHQIVVRHVWQDKRPLQPAGGGAELSPARGYGRRCARIALARTEYPTTQAWTARAAPGGPSQPKRRPPGRKQ